MQFVCCISLFFFDQRLRLSLVCWCCRCCFCFASPSLQSSEKCAMSIKSLKTIKCCLVCYPNDCQHFYYGFALCAQCFEICTMCTVSTDEDLVFFIFDFFCSFLFYESLFAWIRLRHLESKLELLSPSSSSSSICRHFDRFLHFIFACMLHSIQQYIHLLFKESRQLSMYGSLCENRQVNKQIFNRFKWIET